MFNYFKSLLTGEVYRKERLIAILMTTTYIVGNGVEMIQGKVTDDPAVVWVTGILIGISVIVFSLSKNYRHFTSPVFKFFLFYLNFNIILAYGRSTIPTGAEADQGELFYLLFSYALFVICSQGLDSRREVVLFTIGEVALFGICLYWYRANDPLLASSMQLFTLGFVLVGNYVINVQRLKLTQVSVDSNINFKSLSENGRDAQAILKHDYSFVYLNPVISQLTGRPVAELLKMNLRDIVYTEEDFQNILKGLRYIADNPLEKTSVEFQLKQANGNTIWVETIFSFFKATPSAKDHLIFAETRDITQRKLMEESIQRQLQIEELLIRHTNNFITVERTEISEGIDQSLNEFGKILGADAVLIYRTQGKLMDEFRCTNQWYSEAGSDVSTHFNGLVKINQQLVAFLRSLRSEKNLRGTHVSPTELNGISVLRNPVLPDKKLYLVPLPSGNVVTGFMIFVLHAGMGDVTTNFFGLVANMVASAFARLRTETRLQEAQLTNEYILRALPDWVYIVDRNGEFIGGNQYSTLEPYLPEHSIKGKNFLNVMPAEVASKFTNALSDVVQTDAVSSFEYLDTFIYHGRYFKVIVAPFKGAEYLVMIRDITDLKNAQLELENKAEKLAQSNKELEEFAYIVSHDMKQPIRTIISYLTLLKKRHAAEFSEGAMEFLNYSIEGANKMSDLIRDILQYSRLEQQIQDVREVNLNTVISNVKANLKELFNQNEVQLNLPELPVVKGNETMMTELFQNLLENSIKYNLNSTKKITVTVEDKGANWHFTVSDNGIGFDQEYATQIFKIFKRLHNDSEFPGTGIGLTICQKVVEKHGGEIWAESKKGEGSAFHFTLPK